MWKLSQKGIDSERKKKLTDSLNKMHERHKSEIEKNQPFFSIESDDSLKYFQYPTFGALRADLFCIQPASNRAMHP